MNKITNEALQRIRFDDVPWLPYPRIKDSFFRVLRVEEESNVVVLNFKMPAGTITPVHGHHCVAMAYTLKGEWFYENLDFQAGEMAFETTVETHQPVTHNQPAELLTILFGGKGNDRLIEDHNEDGSTTMLKTKFFKAVERISVEDFMKLDMAALID